MFQKTKVIHSRTKSTWNVVGTMPGCKFKIARVPYLPIDQKGEIDRERKEAYEDACFISRCLDNREAILEWFKSN